METTERKEERAVFVGIIKQNDDERKVNEYLEELVFLAETAGVAGDKKFIQKVDKPEKSTYIRTGKLEEIAAYCEENLINYVIFDDELTGMQQRNIEKVIKTAIGQASFLKYSHSEPRQHTLKCKSNSPDTIICCRVLQACGHTSKDRGAVSE